MPLRHFVMVTAILACWAFNAVAIKWGVDELPPLLLTTLRFMIVALILLPFTRIRFKQVPFIILVAFTFGFMHFSLLFVGMTYTDAGTAAMVVQLGTPISMIGAAIFFGEKISFIKITGVAISLAGMVILSGSPTFSSYIGVVILLLSAFGWAISNLLIKSRTDVAPLAMTGWMSLFTVPITGGMSWFMEKGQLHAITHATWHSLFSLVYSAVLCSVIAYSLWYWILRKHNVNNLIPLTLLSPVMAIAFGVLVNGDLLNAFKLSGSAVILLGAFIATTNTETFKRLRVSKAI